MHNGGSPRAEEVETKRDDAEDAQRAYLSLGSNLGNRQRTVLDAMDSLQSSSVFVLKRSALYETEPTDLEDQPWFINAVVEVDTTLSPPALLAHCQRIERDFGRAETVRFGPRTLDIDILLYGRERSDEDSLGIPHPRMRDRRFVLVPLMEIAPNLVDPRDGVRYSETLNRLDEGRKVARSAIIES